MHTLEAQGYQPYLFFPDGVVYIVPDSINATLNQQELSDALWHEVGVMLAGVGREPSDDGEEDQEVEERDGGLKISRTKDYMKVPPVLYELLPPSMLLLAARQAALGIRRPLSAD